MQNFDIELDTRGMNCPLPILKIKKTLRAANAGDVVQMLSSDKGSVKDMEAFCNSTGNILLSSEQQGDEYIYMVEKT